MPSLCRSLVLASLLSMLFMTRAEAEAPSDMKKRVMDLAAQMARDPYLEPMANPAAAAIGYTEYMGIRVKPGSEVWAQQSGGFHLHPMPLGSLFVSPVEVNLIDDGRITPLRGTGDLYEHSLPVDKIPPGGDLGISGFRITAPLNSPKTMDEVIVFQGASYFRALSRGQVYGLSARALSIDVGQPAPEEFPKLTRFWIEEPQTPDVLIIHGLLDSPSVTGAYTFTVKPGATTVIDVEANIFPRKDLDKVGIAPLSSMFFYAVGDGTGHPRDYRPEVHDSDGLLIENGRGERLWRPLRNPTALRASSFIETDLKGFGLMQRERSFSLYQDLEANYHRRPSAWIEPLSDWGAGSVELFEIPTDSEYHDNIVAQWRPAKPLRAGSSNRFAYRISWPDRSPLATQGAVVNWTRSGPAYNALTVPDAERFVIDYRTPNLNPNDLPKAAVTAQTGAISGIDVQQNRETGGLRVSFLYQPTDANVDELRVDLQGAGSDGAETWLYQWVRKKQ